MLGRESVKSVRIELPAPISTNDLWEPIWRKKNGRIYASIVKTKHYVNWIVEAGYKLNTQHPGIVEGPYLLFISVSDECRLDLDNAAKAASDLLQSQGVISNDKLAREIHIVRAKCEGMIVEVRSVEGADNG